MTSSEREPQLFQLFRRLARAQPLQHEQRILDLSVRECLAQRVRRLGRNESQLDADAFGLRGEPAHILGGLLHHVDRAGALGVDLGYPERLDLGLIALHAMAEITGLLRRALHDRRTTGR